MKWRDLLRSIKCQNVFFTLPFHSIFRHVIYQLVLVHAKSVWLCPTIGDLMDCSLPGPSVHGIPQARILERIAMLSAM